MGSRTRSRARRRRARPWTAALVVLAMVGGITTTVALVPRHDTIGAVDAVIVLGGGAGERLALGRELADEREVPLVLSAEAIDEGARSGLTCDVEVVCLEPVPVTTAGEARTTRSLADQRGWDRIAVATSSYHVNRTRMLFGQCHGPRVDVFGVRASGSFATDLYRYTRELAGRIAGATIRRAC